MHTQSQAGAMGALNLDVITNEHVASVCCTCVGLCLYAAFLWEGTANAAVYVLLCHCQLSQLLSAKKTNYDVEALISYIYYP